MNMKLSLFGISLLTALFFSIPCFAELILTKEYLTDEYNDEYGVKFFARNTDNVTLNARASVTSRDNVKGDVISGNFLLAPNATVLYGIFGVNDEEEDWSVDTEVTTSRDPFP